MVRKAGLGLILTLAVLYAPWWLGLAAMAASAVLFTSPFPPLALGLFLNFSYGAVGVWPVGLTAVAGVMPLGWLARRLIRLK